MRRRLSSGVTTNDSVSVAYFGAGEGSGKALTDLVLVLSCKLQAGSGGYGMRSLGLLHAAKNTKRVIVKR